MSVPRHHVFAYVDIEGSSRLSIPDKEAAQNDVAKMLDAACAEAGITEAKRDDRGDGYLLVSLTEGVPLRDVVAAFAGTLDTALAARTVGENRLRLRLVVHHGEIFGGEHGWRGPDLDRGARLVDAVEVKEALKAAPDGRMAFVVAPEVYHSVVRGYPRPDPTAFRMRRLATKEGELEAWLTITGAAAQPGREADEELAPPAAAALPGQTVIGTANKSPIGNTVGGGIHYGTERLGGR